MLKTDIWQLQVFLRSATSLLLYAQKETLTNFSSKWAESVEQCNIKDDDDVIIEVEGYCDTMDSNPVMLSARASDISAVFVSRVYTKNA